MKQAKNLWLLLLFLFISSTISQANQIHPLKLHVENQQKENNRLTLQHNNSGKTFTFYAEQEVTIWTADRKQRGIFKKANDERLVLRVEGADREIPFTDIRKMKVFSEGSKKGIGILLLGIGLLAGFFGGLSLVVGLLALAAGELGAIIIVAVPFLLIPGFLLYKLGDNMYGKNLKINRKWTIME